MMGAVKRGDNKFLNDAAIRVKEEWDTGWYDDWFAGDVTLIPVPGSAPLKDQNGLWVPNKICEALLAAAVGREVMPCLVRNYKVKKNASQPPGNRATVQEQYDSMGVQTDLVEAPYDRIVVVDDFITKGRTLTAACSRIQEAFPAATVRAFTYVRSKGFDEVDQLVEPFEGEVRYNGYDANRQD
jgi:hypothetical protein